VHMAGTDSAGKNRNITIPIRNPSPFYWDGSNWQLRDSAKQALGKHIRDYIYMETL
jgi:hypothetical protein